MMTPTPDVPVQAPRALPSVSVIPGLFQQSPFFFLNDTAKTHGGFVRLNIGMTSVYLVSEPALFQHILRDNVKNYRKSPFLYNSAKAMVGEGLLTSEGDFWLRQRRIMQPQFHRQRIAFFADIMAEVIAGVMQMWDETMPDDKIVDLEGYMAQVAVEVVSRAVFGTTTLDSETVKKLGHEMMAAANYIALRGYMPFIPKIIPLPGHGRFKSAMTILTQAVNSIIAFGLKNEADDNLITMLLHAVDEETQEAMTPSQLFDEVMTIFAAGFETSSTALTWVWALLSQAPEVEAKLRTEIETVLGGRLPTLADLPKLSYCRQVFQEVLRYYPPSPMLPRTALGEDVLEGHNIAKGSIMLLFYHGLHHNTDYWEDPEKFDPSRFNPEQVEARHRFAYLPFSTGPRQCIGSEFAMMEGVIALTMLLQHYRVEVVEGQDFSPNLSATLKPSKGIKARLHRL